MDVVIRIIGLALLWLLATVFSLVLLHLISPALRSLDIREPLIRRLGGGVLIHLMVIYAASAFVASLVGIPITKKMASLLESDILLIPIAGMAFASFIRVLIVYYPSATLFPLILWVGLSATLLMFVASYNSDAFLGLIRSMLELAQRRELQPVTPLFAVSIFSFATLTEVVNEAWRTVGTPPIT